jgi:hypothetical protein
MPPAIRIALLFLVLAACSDRAERDGLGARGTALPPPDPVTGAPLSLLPAR